MAGRLASAGADRFRLAHNGDINVTPFVDVMLVLLIIFMLAMPLATTDLKLNLPPARATATPVEPTVISLRADGRLYIGETPTTLCHAQAGPRGQAGRREHPAGDLPARRARGPLRRAGGRRRSTAHRPVP